MAPMAAFATRCRGASRQSPSAGGLRALVIRDARRQGLAGRRRTVIGDVGTAQRRSLSLLYASVPGLHGVLVTAGDSGNDGLSFDVLYSFFKKSNQQACARCLPLRSSRFGCRSAGQVVGSRPPEHPHAYTCVRSTARRIPCREPGLRWGSDFINPRPSVGLATKHRNAVCAR